MDASEATGTKPPRIVIPFATLPDPDRRRWHVPPWPAEIQPGTPNYGPSPLHGAFNVWAQFLGDAAALAPPELLEAGRQAILHAAGSPRELFEGDPPPRAGSVMAFDPAGGPDTTVVGRFTWGNWGDGLPAESGQATAHRLPETHQLSAEEAFSIMQRWGRDELDDVTRREINESLERERPRPRPANNTRAHVYNDRLVVSWENSGAHVEKWIVERSIDGEDFEVIAELPAEARKFADYDYLRDLHYEYYIQVYPNASHRGALSRVIIPPVVKQSMRDRLEWRARECCTMMFGVPYYPGIEHYRSLRKTTRCIVETVMRTNMLQDIMRSVASRPGNWAMPFRPDMP